MAAFVDDPQACCLCVYMDCTVDSKLRMAKLE